MEVAIVDAESVGSVAMAALCKIGAPGSAYITPARPEMTPKRDSLVTVTLATLLVVILTGTGYAVSAHYPIPCPDGGECIVRSPSSQLHGVCFYANDTLLTFLHTECIDQSILDARYITGFDNSWTMAMGSMSVMGFAGLFVLVTIDALKRRRQQVETEGYAPMLDKQVSA